MKLIGRSRRLNEAVSLGIELGHDFVLEKNNYNAINAYAYVDKENKHYGIVCNKCKKYFLVCCGCIPEFTKCEGENS